VPAPRRIMGSEMSEFTVHSIPGSPFGRPVLAALEEKGAAYRVKAVAPGALKQPPHLGLHPFGRIPVLEHDGFVLYETQAILRYLDRVLPTPPLTPSDPKLAARMDQVMNITDWYLFTGCNSVIGFQRVVGPKLMGLVPDETVIEAAMPRAHMVFAELSRLLGDRPYFAGDEVTLADLMVMGQLDFFPGHPEWAPLTAGRENLVSFLERMSARPSFEATTWERVADRAEAA
jgi:glutathione S-transferase